MSWGQFILDNAPSDTVRVDEHGGIVIAYPAFHNLVAKLIPPPKDAPWGKLESPWVSCFTPDGPAWTYKQGRE